MHRSPAKALMNPFASSSKDVLHTTCPYCRQLRSGTSTSLAGAGSRAARRGLRSRAGRVSWMPLFLRVITIIDSGLIKIIDGLSSKRRAA